MDTKHQCNITMFPAKDGDCFLLEFISGEDEFRMMIDAGPVAFGEKKLKDSLKQLHSRGKKIDLLMITHFDRDHIGGALPILRSKRLSPVIGEIWHNGLAQVAPDLSTSPTEDDNDAICEILRMYQESDSAKTGEISVDQSLHFSELIATREIPVNQHMNGSAITDQTFNLTLGKNKDIEVFFLLPRRDHLDALMEYYEDELRDRNLDARPVFTNKAEKAFHNLMCRVKSHITKTTYISGSGDLLEELDEYAQSTPEQDDSITNASCITMIFRYHGKKMLFTGDAVGGDLVKALDIWRHKYEDNLIFDVVKLPHHGSCHNCPYLLDMPDFGGKRFLISTNGKHGHPDKETIARLLKRQKSDGSDIILNYRHIKYDSLYKDFLATKTNDIYLRLDEKFPLFEEEDI